MGFCLSGCVSGSIPLLGCTSPEHITFHFLIFYRYFALNPFRISLFIIISANGQRPAVDVCGPPVLHCGFLHPHHHHPFLHFWPDLPYRRAVPLVRRLPSGSIGHCSALARHPPHRIEAMHHNLSRIPSSGKPLAIYSRGEKG